MWLHLPTQLLETAGGDGGGGGSGGSGAGQGAGQGAGSGGQGGQQGGQQGGAPASIMQSGGQGAGQGGGGQQGGQQGQQQPTPWAWNDATPGQGDRPAWFKHDKYKTIEAQAQAAVGLETKLGKAADLIGAPEGGNYALPEVKIPMADGKEPVKWEWDLNNPMLSSFQKVANEMGLSQAAHDRIAGAVAMAMYQQQTADEQSVAQALADLGPNVENRINAVNKFVVATYGEEGFKALDAAVGANPQAWAIIEKMVAKISGDSTLANLAGMPATRMSKEQIMEKQREVYPQGHPMQGKSRYNHDATFRAEVDKMWKDAFPGEDNERVG